MIPPKTAEEKTLSRDMGLGRLADPTMVFVRNFRWTLTAESLDGTDSLPEWFQTKVKVDFYHNKLYFESLEVMCHDNVLNWIESVKANPDKKRWMVLTTYDGLGNQLYTYQFNGISIGEREVNYDYDSSDVATQKITIYFTDYSLTQTEAQVREQPNLEQLAKQAEPNWNVHNRADWRVSFADDQNNKTEARKIILDSRPSVEVEETEINYLNAKSWIPGKGHWSKVALIVQTEDLGWFLSNLGLSRLGCRKMTLSLYRDNVRIESWLIEYFEICKMEKIKPDQQKITIQPHSFAYTNS